jgi:hypothetical protein
MWYWWLFLSVGIFNVVAIKVKSTIKAIEYYSVITTCLIIAEIHDRWTDELGTSYGFFKKGTMDWQTLLITIGIYPAAVYLMLTWFPYGKSLFKRFMYIIAWAVFSVAFEYSYHLIGYEYFTGGWKLWYSAIYYPFIYIGVFLILKFVRFIAR